MERYVQEIEPKVKHLFSEVNFKGFDLIGFMSNIAMDYFEDLVEHKNQLSPQKLLEIPKYHCFKRFIKEAGLFTPFISLANEYWDKSRVNM